jgi:hypothetical protein
MAEPLNVIISFVTGELEVHTFEQLLYHDAALEALLTSVPAPSRSGSGVTLYHYLIPLDYDDPGEILDAHGVLADYLTQRGVVFTPSTSPSATYDLILSAQPHWLNADAKYISSLLAEAPALAPRDLKVWLRKRILELFKYRSRPPRWIQSPEWPIGHNGPMVFLGQLSVPDYFHDDAAIYVFHDPTTGECRCVVQVG